MTECANCGSARGIVDRAGWAVCVDCDWPLGAIVPPGDFCSICRRHHGPEVEHAAE